MRTLPSVTILAVLLASACVGTEPGDPIVGRWQVTGDDAEIEFLPDGTVEISEGAETERLSWERLEDGRILLQTINLTGKDATPQLIQIDMLESGSEAFVTSAGKTTRIQRIDQN